MTKADVTDKKKGPDWEYFAFVVSITNGKKIVGENIPVKVKKIGVREMKRYLSITLLLIVLPAMAIAQMQETIAKKNMRHAQEILLYLGFDPGEPDGMMGPMTRQAITFFQKQQGIHQTSTLDENTWKILWKKRNGLIPDTVSMVTRRKDSKISGMVIVTSSSQKCRSLQLELDLRSETSFASDAPVPIFSKGILQVFRGHCCIPAPDEPYAAQSDTRVEPDTIGAMGLVDGRIVSESPVLITGSVSIDIPPESRVFVFHSSDDNELVFELTAGGYRYVSGKGTLALPGGIKYTFSGTR